jgi:O-antigen/teichoic acid export membrane protein
MRLRDHWQKIVWAYADRSLPMLYGVGFVFLVVRRLPKPEYGLFAIAFAFLMIALNQMKYVLFSGLVRYLAPPDAPTRSLVTASLALAVSMSLPFAAALFALQGLLAKIFNAPGFVELVPLLVALFFILLLRDYCITFLSVRIQSRRIFWLDLTYYGFAFLLLVYAGPRGQLATAADVFKINLAAAVLSLVVGLGLSSTYWRFELRLSRDALKKLFRFGRYGFASGIGLALQNELDTIILGAVMNPVAVATYASGKIFFRFYNLQDQLLLQVGYPALCRVHSAKDRQAGLDLTEKMMAYSLVVIFAASLVFLALAHPVMNFIYRTLYPEAPVVFSILVLGTFVGPINSVISLSYGATERLRAALLMTWLNLGIAIAAISVGVYAGRIYGVAIAMAVVPWIMVGFQWYQIRKVLPITVSGIIRRWGDVRDIRKLLRSSRTS